MNYVHFYELDRKGNSGTGEIFLTSWLSVQPLQPFQNLAGLFSYQLNTCMAMAARKSRIHNKSILFFQMQAINPNTVLISFPERHSFIKLSEDKLVA